MAGKSGSYRFCYVYARYNDAGTMVLESGRSPITGPTTVTGSTSYGFTNPPAGSQYNRVRIYSTLASGTIYYLEKVVTVTADGALNWTTLSMADGTLDDQATAYFTGKGYEVKRLYADGVLPPLRYVVEASRRVWGAGRMHRTGTNEDSTIYWSELAPNWRDWPTANGESIFAKPITGLYARNEIVYVFTRSSRWRCTPANYNQGIAFDELDTQIGCIGHHTIQHIGQATIWLAQDGFYATRGDAEPTPVSTQIEGTIASILKQRGLSFIAEPYDRENHEYRCWVSTSDKALNDTCLAFETYDGFQGRWDVRGGKGRTATYVTSGVLPDGRMVYFSGDHLGCVYQDEIGWSDGANEGGTYQGVLSVGTTTSSTTTTSTTTT